MSEYMKISAKEGGYQGALQELLSGLLQNKVVDAVMTPMKLPYKNAIMQTVIHDPEMIKNAAPLAPIVPLNAAKILSQLTYKDSGRKLAAIMRPCEVRAFVELVKLHQGSLDNLLKDDGNHWIDLDSRFTLGDLQEFEVARAACKKAEPDLVFHLADIVAGIDYVFGHEPFIFRANILINTHTFTAAAEAGVRQMAYLGTACSYPQELQEKPGNPPLVEDQVLPADPESAYGWSKLMGEYEAEL